MTKRTKSTRPAYLTKKEFFDVYGISLIGAANSIELTVELAPRLFQIAEKYIAITDYAVRTELRHLRSQCLDPYGIDKAQILSASRDRRTMSLGRIEKAFRLRGWDMQYGGRAWASIVQGLVKLVNAYTAKDFNGVLLAIDHLNDLEHNNNFYLASYTTFNLTYALDCKAEALPEGIFPLCSPKVRFSEKHELSEVAKYRSKGNV